MYRELPVTRHSRTLISEGIECCRANPFQEGRLNRICASANVSSQGMQPARHGELLAVCFRCRSNWLLISGANSPTQLESMPNAACVRTLSEPSCQSLLPGSHILETIPAPSAAP